MYKWKPGFLLKKISKLEINLKNESGITLVELLATLSILSVVILLAGSVHMFGQRQFISQTESASQANNISYAMSVMSSDLRKLKPTDVKVEKEKKIIVQNDLTYQLQGDKLLKGTSVIAESINSMQVEQLGTHSIKIRLIGNSVYSKSKIYETRIAFRGESEVTNAEKNNKE